MVKRVHALMEQVSFGMQVPFGLQAGFRPERGTIDGPFAVMVLLKRRQEHGLWAFLENGVHARHGARPVERPGLGPEAALGSQLVGRAGGRSGGWWVPGLYRQANQPAQIV